MLFGRIGYPIRIHLTVSFVTASALLFLVFASDNTLDDLGMMDNRTVYTLGFGLGLVFSSAAIIIRFGVHAIHWGLIAHSRSTVITTRQEGLHHLTEPQKAILRRFIMIESKTQTLPSGDGAVKGLRFARIIYRFADAVPSDTVDQSSPMFDYIIHDWAWDYINKHPEIL